MGARKDAKDTEVDHSNEKSYLQMLVQQVNQRPTQTFEICQIFYAKLFVLIHVDCLYCDNCTFSGLVLDWTRCQSILGRCYSDLWLHSSKRPAHDIQPQISFFFIVQSFELRIILLCSSAWREWCLSNRNLYWFEGHRCTCPVGGQETFQQGGVIS